MGRGDVSSSVQLDYEALERLYWQLPEPMRSQFQQQPLVQKVRCPECQSRLLDLRGSIAHIKCRCGKVHKLGRLSLTI